MDVRTYVCTTGKNFKGAFTPKQTIVKKTRTDQLCKYVCVYVGEMTYISTSVLSSVYYMPHNTCNKDNLECTAICCSLYIDTQ